MRHANQRCEANPPNGEVFASTSSVASSGTNVQASTNAAQDSSRKDGLQRSRNASISLNYKTDTHISTLRRSGVVSQSHPSPHDQAERSDLRRHFILETLKTQGMTLATCAKRLGVSLEEAERQAEPYSNLTLEQLFAWSDALDAPISELLPFDLTTSDPIRNRALMLRIVKTARQLQNLSRNTTLEYAATSLVDQLIELVPEYAVVEPWSSVGKSRVAKSEGLLERRVDSETSKFIEERSLPPYFE